MLRIRRKITGKTIKKGVIARYAEGEKMPRSFRKDAAPQEIEILNHLKSSGVGLPGFQVVKGRLYVKSAGRSLEDINIVSDLTAADRKEIASQIADKIGQIHRAGVEHQGIQPQNILWDAGRGAASLIDFEHAKKPQLDWQAEPRELISKFWLDFYYFCGLVRKLGLAAGRESYLPLFRKIVSNYPVPEPKKQELLDELERRFGRRFGSRR